MIQDKTRDLTFQEKLYIETNIEEFGRSHDIDTWEDNAEKRKFLADQTKQIAIKLQEGYQIHGLGWSKTENVRVYEHQDLTLMGLHSKQFKKLDNYRNIIFLPSVAQKNRTPKVKQLELFLKHHKNCRMWTFTAGPRCNLSQLQTNVQWMHRKLSKLNDQDFMKECGAKFVFRSTEFGELAHNGPGDLSLHPHMHALMELDRYLRPDDWSYLLERIRAFWGVYCKDCGKIRNSRELVKYCVKPGDLDGLNNEQLVKLYHKTDGLRLWESLQTFRKMRRSIREEKQKVVMRKGIPKLVPNWNRGASKTPEELQVQRQKSALRAISGQSAEPTAKIVAWCSPAPVFTHVTEPLFLVHGLNGRDPAEFFNREEVLRMEHFISVHTKTLTVPNQQSKTNQTNESKQEIYPTSASPPGIHQVHQ